MHPLQQLRSVPKPGQIRGADAGLQIYGPTTAKKGDERQFRSLSTREGQIASSCSPSIEVHLLC